MAQPILVNQSTTLIQIDTSILTNSPHIVLLSNVNSPGSMITIRDTTGNASQINRVIISTTNGVSYIDGGGPLKNIYTINQPYGFLTVTPKTPNIWGVINTFAFPDESASANLNFLNVSSINISTIGYIQHALISTASISTLCTNNVYIRDNLSVGQSTIAHAGFYVCTIRTLENIIASSNIYAGSTMSSLFGNFTSTLTVPYISTTDVWINGGLQTTSSISTSGPMFVGSSISTTGNLAVGASTFIQGQLTVLQAAFFRSSISTTGALNVGYETILHSSLQLTHNAFIGGNVSTMSNVTIGASLSVMSSLYTRWDMYTTSSILAVSSISTLTDVNIGRNLSTLGKAFIGQELYTTSSILTTGTFSTLQDVNVRSNVSILGNLYVKGTVQFDNNSMAFQDIVASSILTQYNISSMSSLIAGGGLYVTQSTILFGTVSTMSNFNIAGLLSTASTIVAGDSLIVAKTGYFGSSISTPSSIGVGGMLMVGGGVILQSTLSTFGQAAFFSSVQIQGSLSVMSSIVAACNVFVGNTLVTSNLTLYGSTSISTLAVTNTIGFGLNISSSTLHHGLFSTTGGMNIGGLISTTNALIVGSTINTQFLQVQQTMSVFSNAGFAQDISARSSLYVNMSTVVNGGFWANKSATMADTHYTGPVVMDGNLTVGGNVIFGSGTGGNITLNNNLQVAFGVPQNRISNDTFMRSLEVAKDVPYSNITTNQSAYNYAQVQISHATQSGKLYLGNAYTGGAGTCSVIQSSDYFSSADHGTSLLLNPLGGYVGIGTNSSETKLQVVGDTVSGDHIFPSTDTIFSVLSQNTYNTGTRTMMEIGSYNSACGNFAGVYKFLLGFSNTTTGSGGNFIIQSVASGSSYTANGIILTPFTIAGKTGNVGINCNSPAYALDVNGNTNVNGIVTATSLNATNDVNVGTGTTTLRLTTLGTITYIQSGSITNFAPIYFTANSGVLQQMALDTTGLGIGTSAPAYKLDVNGDINYTGNLRKNGVVVSGAPAGINSAGKIGINKAASTTYALDVNGSVNIMNPSDLGSVTNFVGWQGDGICINSTGTNLYFSGTSTQLIRKTVVSTGATVVLAGSIRGFADGTGTAAEFRDAFHICVDSTETNLYIADVENVRIRKLVIGSGTANSGVVTTLAGGTSGWADGVGLAARFRNPQGICIDSTGTNLYVTDYGNERIRKIVIATAEVTTLAGSSASGFADGTGTAAQFNRPIAICIDSTGTNLYICDYAAHRIRKLVIGNGTADSGVVTTLAGSVNGTPGAVDGIGSAATFNNPQGICIDSTGTNLYVAEGGNIVRKIVIATGAVSTLAGDGTLGSTNGTGTSARFRGPRGICIDSTGTNLYVTESGSAYIRKISLSTSVTIGENVGINTTSPQYTLDVNGDIYASANITAYSDVRAKENILTIDSALDKVMALRGVYYTRKDNPGPRHVGVIAQEVEAILPEVVMTDSEGKKSVAYGNIVALLLEGMKEQQEMIQGQKSTIESLASSI